MYKLLLFISLLVVQVACSNMNPEQKLRKNIEKIIIQDFDDPKSYEFVSIEILEPYSKADSIYDEYLFFENIYKDDYVNKYQKSLETYTDYVMEFGENSSLAKLYYKYQKEDKDELDKYFERAKEMLRQSDSADLKSQKIKNRAKFEYRANNVFGGKILDSFIFYYDDELNVIDIED